MILQSAYVTRLKLEKIRAFKSLDISLSDEDGPRMLSVIIGRNGTCKSTLLRCIALGLGHEQDAGALLSQPGSQLVSEGADEGLIALEVTGHPDAIRLRIGRKGDRDVVLERQGPGLEMGFLLCGYGAGRGNIGSTQTRDYRVMDAAATLFDYHQNLVDSELMLRRLEDFLGTARYEQAMMGVRRVLGLRAEHRIEYAKGGGVRISGPGIGRDIPLDSWADGYRLTFNWMIDLYGWAMRADAVTEKGGVRGILLIDEVEQHLHPSMQTELLNELRKALPEMQVFATTHSPLVALGTQSENIVALHRKGDRVFRASVPSLVGYTAEDALVEEALFGTDPYPSYSRDKLDQYRALLSVPSSERTPKQIEELGRLATELDPAKLPSLRDDPIAKRLDEIAELLTQEKAT